MSLSFPRIFLSNKRYSIVVLLFIIISIITTSFFPWLSKILLDSIFAHRSASFLKYIIGVVILLVVVQLFASFVVSYVSSLWTQKLCYNLRCSIFQKFIHDTSNSSLNNLQVLLISDCDTVANGCQSLLITSFSSLLSLSVYISIIFIINKVFFWVVLLTVPLFYLVSLQLNSIAQLEYRKTQSAKDNLLSYILDIIPGFDFIKIYNIYDLININFKGNANALKNESIKYTTTITFLQGLLSLLTTVTPFALLIYGINLTYQHVMTVGTLIALNTYSASVFSPTSQLINMITLYKQVRVSLTRIQEQGRSINVQPDSKISNHFILSSELDDLKYIKLSHVSYRVNNTNILTNISYQFNKPVTILTGVNGSGKSTLMRLISGIILPNKGDIHFNKINCIQYVPTTNFIFKGSLYYNCTLGVNEPDQDLLRTLLSKFNLRSFELNKTISTSKCSTGELQKIKLVHALMFKPDLLICDEIFSNMDLSSRSNCLKYLASLDGPLIIIVSHNKSEIEQVIPNAYTVNLASLEGSD